MNYVGIDIGGTNIKAGLIDDSGAVRDTRRAPSIIDDIDGLLRTLTTIVAEFQIACLNRSHRHRNSRTAIHANASHRNIAKHALHS